MRQVSVPVDGHTDLPLNLTQSSLACHEILTGSFKEKFRSALKPEILHQNIVNVLLQNF